MYRITDWLLTCNRANPNIDNCFKQLFEHTFPYLAKGIPEIGVPHFEPLHISKVSVSRGSGNLNLQGGFHNLIVHGPSNTTVRRASLDMDKKVLDFELEIPRLRINAQYNLKGQILLLPIVGNGDVAMTLKNVKTRVVTKFSLQNLPEEAIHIDEMRVTFIVGGLRIHLDNLFNGNKVLSASLNMFLNQNAHEVLAELKSDLEHGLEGIFTILWNKLFTKMPLKLWLL
uniref:CSON010873 protein n=1 Tax=Culicoides sonorensis TaxID=179676 RepID=A0A336M7Y7_CULSO